MVDISLLALGGVKGIVNSSKLRAALLLIFVMFIWGLNIVALKVLMDNSPPITMTALRILAAGTVVSIVVILRQNIRMLTKKEWLYTLPAGFFGIFGNQIFLAFGLVQTTAANAALILALVPLASVIFAKLFLKDKLTAFKVGGIILGFIGVAIIVFYRNGSLGGGFIGDLYIFGAMLTQALSYVFIKKATDTLDTVQMTGIMLILGSLLLFVLSFIVEPQGIGQIKAVSQNVWVIFLLSAIIATGIGHIIYNTEVHELGVGQAAIFTNLVPFFSLIGAVIFLGEKIVISQVVGFILIVTGVALGSGYFEKKDVVNSEKDILMTGLIQKETFK